jgi:hypothetical protein
MSEETTVDVVAPKDKGRGERGEVGTPSPGDVMKKLHREKGFGSLKDLARKLEKDGNEVAAEWFANKAGAANQSRNDANAKRAIESALATKTSRKKVKGK